MTIELDAETAGGIQELTLRWQISFITRAELSYAAETSKS